MILKGDCIEVMKAIKPNSVDAIACDPPYGLEFMGKEWDKLWDKRNKDDQSNEGIKTFLRVGKNLTAYKAGIDMQLWHTQWLTEAYRVLKPGGSMLVMGGTRTSHRLACAIEDTGFIIKDTLMWLYGSGFPKAQDLGKMIDKRMGKDRKIIGKRITGRAGTRADKRNANLGFESGQMMINETLPSTDLAKHWDGFKVGGIKPAYEPIIWAVKPPEGSYVDNVLKWGVGAVNVDECRVGTESTQINRKEKSAELGYHGRGSQPNITGSPKGRFPTNVILDEEAGRMLDEQSGGVGGDTRKNKSTYDRGIWGSAKPIQSDALYNDSGGASRFFYCAKASRGERNAGLEGMEEKDSNYRTDYRPKAIESGDKGQDTPFAGTNRSGGIKNNHPTVKPIKLFEWLIKLVTREGQIVLDPFIGSGTTSIAAHNTGRKCVGIEKEGEYLEIAKRRIEYWETQPKQMEINA